MGENISVVAYDESYFNLLAEKISERKKDEVNAIDGKYEIKISDLKKNKEESSKRYKKHICDLEAEINLHEYKKKEEIGKINENYSFANHLKLSLQQIVGFLKKHAETLEVFNKESVDVIVLMACCEVDGERRTAEDIELADWDTKRLQEIIRRTSGKNLILVVNSFGGKTSESLFIMNLLHTKYAKGKIIAVVPHVAASAATILCMGCHEIWMGETAYLGGTDILMDNKQGKHVVEEITKLDLKYLVNRDSSILKDKLCELCKLYEKSGVPIGYYTACKKQLENVEFTLKQWLMKYMFLEVDEGNKKAHHLSKWLNHLPSHDLKLSRQALIDHGCMIKNIEDDFLFFNLINGVYLNCSYLFKLGKGVAEDRDISKIICDNYGYTAFK